VGQSGERPGRTGRISHQGQAHARGLLIEAAHAAIRTRGASACLLPPGQRSSGHARRARRNGTQTARTLLAPTHRQRGLPLPGAEPDRTEAARAPGHGSQRWAETPRVRQTRASAAGARAPRAGRAKLPRLRRQSSKGRGCRQGGRDSFSPSRGIRCAAGSKSPRACASRRGHLRQHGWYAEAFTFSSVAKGEHAPGDGDLGDLLAAVLGDSFVAGAEGHAAGGACWAASTKAQRSAGEPCPEMCPSRALPSEERTVGVSPAQAQSWRALGKRVMSPTSAITSIAM
jgi:Transposase IS116/IS110/IS902 family